METKKHYSYLFAIKSKKIAETTLNESEAFNKILNLITEHKTKDLLRAATQTNWKIANDNLKKAKNKWFVAISYYCYLILLIIKFDIEKELSKNLWLLNKFYNDKNSKIINKIIKNLILRNSKKEYNSSDYIIYYINAYHWKQAYIAWEIAAKNYILILKQMC